MNKVNNFWKAAIVGMIAILMVACGGSGSGTEESAAEPTAVANTTETQSNTADTTDTTTDNTTDSATSTTTKINLNDMTQEELLNTIPGFGERMVREFFEYQPYVSIQQFRREIGKYVDETQVAEYEQYVYVPVDVNEADADTLQQLPGVDASIADDLIAARPYDSNEAFLTKLGEYVSSSDGTAAQAYLANQ